MMPDAALTWIVVAALCALLVVAALGKLADLAKFSAAIQGYRLVPPGLAGLASLALPCLELAAAGCLLIPSLRTAGAWLAAGLLASYAAAMAINLARGRSNLDCGCFGPARRERIASWMVVRNLVLAALALALTVPPPSRALEALDWLTISAGTFATVCLYLAIETLARNQPIIRSARS